MTCYAHRSNIPLPPCSGMMAMLDGNRTLRASMISHPEPDWQLVHLGRREAAIPQSAIPRIPGNDHQCFRNGRCWTGTCRSRRSSRTSVLSHDLPVVGRPMSDAESQIFEPQVRTGSYFSTEPNNLLPLRSRRQSGGLACFRQLAGVAIDRGVAAPRLAHLAGRWIIQLIYLGRLARPLVYLGSQRAFGRLAQWLEL